MTESNSYCFQQQKKYNTKHSKCYRLLVQYISHAPWVKVYLTFQTAIYLKTGKGKKRKKKSCLLSQNLNDVTGIADITDNSLTLT